jgi:DNA (cytosine-5)-methyltransferase 1
MSRAGGIPVVHGGEDVTAVSLFAGVEGFGLAMHRAGIRVVASVEIDPACRGVIARHFPQAALFGDIAEVKGEQLAAAGFVPGRGVIAFGWPCTDLSVAGRRAGLDGARSGLFWHAVRLIGELRPRWFVAENVPGLLSAVCQCPGDGTCVRNGRAVGCGRWEPVRGGVPRWLPHVQHSTGGGACPRGCMAAHGGAMGTVLGALGQFGHGVAYRVLDAQFFGVPQHRERVFFVGCAGNWTAPVEVLLEPESSSGDPAPGTPAGPRVAGASGDGAEGGRTVGTLGTTGPGCGWRVGADEAAAGQLVTTAATLQGGGRRGHRIDAEGAAGGHLMVATGAMAFNPQTGGSAARLGYGPTPTALQASQVTGVITPAATLTSGAAAGDGVNKPGRRREDDWNSEGADASEDGTGRGTPLVPMTVSENQRGELVETPISHQLTTGGGKPGQGYPAVREGMAVRRLTPKECERLQAFPDDWTKWLADGREQSDSARYRQLGNAVCVAVAEWIMRRLAAVDASAERKDGAA